MEISSVHHHSQTVRARELTFWEKVHLLQPVMCHVSESWNCGRMFTPNNMSHVTCHMSHVMCHMSRVTCHMSRVICHVSQNDGASRWRVCYLSSLNQTIKIVLKSFERLWKKKIIATHNFLVGSFCLLGNLNICQKLSWNKFVYTVYTGTIKQS